MEKHPMTLSWKQIVIAVVISLLFSAISLLQLSQNNVILTLIPFALSVVLLTMVRSDWILLGIVFCAPLSVPLLFFNKSLPFDMNLPTEPLLALLLGLYVVKRIMERSVNIKILYHPVSVCIYIYLSWIFLTACASTMPLISFKFLLVRLWFIVAFFFMMLHFFEKPMNMVLFVIAYTVSFLIVIGYTLLQHSAYFFSQGMCYEVMQPFYNDHTSYGAALAMIIPLLFIVRLIVRRDWNFNALIVIALSVVFIATLFSYTRAAWLSLFLVFGLWWIIKLQISFKNLAIVGGIIAVIAIPVLSQTYLSMKTNTAKYSSDFSAHVKSMGNLSSDASNRERMNRWSCAWRMFLDKPVFGWGPGTYMFQYAPYQLSADKTEISTNAATLGNAHSEYMGPLAETGIIGLLSFLSIIIATIHTATKVYKRSQSTVARSWVVLALLSLCTYYMHGFLNDFLDVDKIAVLFWGATAMIVAFDIYQFEGEVVGVRQTTVKS